MVASIAISRWAKIKRKLINKYGHACMVCGHEIVVECDHIIPRAYGGEDKLNNAVLLCANCHHIKNRVYPQLRIYDKPPMYWPKSRQEEIEGIKRFVEDFEQGRIGIDGLAEAFDLIDY